MRLMDLLAQTPGARLARPSALDPNPTITHVTFDSRLARPGALFVALRGARADGHAYLAQVASHGASAILIARDVCDEDGALDPLPDTLAIACVEDTRAALAPLAAAFFDHPGRDLSVVGVTGTNGKTTTTFLLEAILSQLGHKVGVIGTVNYRWPGTVEDAPNTTPESLVLQHLLARMRDDGVDTVLLEVSSHGLATHRLDALPFDVALFTNLTQDHLDFHHTMDAYRDAKASLFTERLPWSASVGKSPVAILNLDDPEGRRLSGLVMGIPALRSIGVGLHAPDAAWRAVGLTHDRAGAHLTLQEPLTHDAWPTRAPLPGAHNALNALQAMVAAITLGHPPESVAAVLMQAPGVAGRLERVDAPEGAPAIFIDYAHSPDALARALDTLRPLADAQGGRLWCVFGCGGERDRAKRPIMGDIAQARASRLVLTSDNPRGEAPEAIIDAILTGLPDARKRAPITRVAPERGLAIDLAITLAAGEDVILIAGKGHEDYQEVAGVRRPFSDRERAAEAARARDVTTLSRWDLERARAACGGSLRRATGAPQPATDAAERGWSGRVVTDSRQVREGDLFVALVGDRFDAHDFLPQVERAGAAAAVVQHTHTAPDALPCIIVPDTLTALQALGAAIWHSAQPHTIALTGSNGKTTTKELLRALWAGQGAVHATTGNLNNHIGLPLTLCALPARANIAALELGASKPHDIAELIALAPATVRLITSIGYAHTETMGGDLDGVRRVKAELFNDATAQTIAIVPHHERDALIPPNFPGQVWTFGPEEGADVRVVEARVTDAAITQVTLAHRDQRWTLSLPLIGAHHASNLAGAWATLCACDALPAPDEIADCLRAVRVPGGRWRAVEVGELLFLDDAYNANPSSVRASFEAFLAWQAALARPGKRVAVLGPMLELGPDEKNWHITTFRAMTEAADLSVAIAMGPLAAELVEAARDSAHPALTLIAAQDHAQVAQALLALGPAIVLLKASRGARLERVIDIVQDGQGRGRAQ